MDPSIPCILSYWFSSVPPITGRLAGENFQLVGLPSSLWPLPEVTYGHPRCCRSSSSQFLEWCPRHTSIIQLKLVFGLSCQTELGWLGLGQAKSKMVMRWRPIRGFFYEKMTKLIVCLGLMKILGPSEFKWSEWIFEHGVHVLHMGSYTNRVAAVLI
jgi:hypothetical protein